MHTAVALATLMVICLTMVCVLVVFLSCFRPWLRGFTCRCRISVLDIIGMRMRRVNPGKVIDAYIMAQESGTPIAVNELESAYLRKVDLQKVTLAYIDAQKRDASITFEEIVTAEQQDRLKSLLDGPSRTFH